MNQPTHQPETFDQWAIVEIMGHQVYAGRVTETQIAGDAFIQVDVPEVTLRPYGGESRGTQPAFTKIFGAKSIYAITPCTEAAAREAAASAQARPVTIIDTAHRLPPPEESPPLEAGDPQSVTVGPYDDEDDDRQF